PALITSYAFNSLIKTTLAFFKFANEFIKASFFSADTIVTFLGSPKLLIMFTACFVKALSASNLNSSTIFSKFSLATLLKAFLIAFFLNAFVVNFFQFTLLVGPKVTPPPLHNGDLDDPALALPVPFCLHGFFPPPLTSDLSLVFALPCL